MLIAGVFMALLFLAIGFKPEWRKNWKHYLVTGVLNSAVAGLFLARRIPEKAFMIAMQALTLVSAVRMLF